MIGEWTFLGSFQKQHLLEQASSPELCGEALARIFLPPPASLIFVFTKRKWKRTHLALKQHPPSPGLCYSLSVSPACDFTCRGTEDFYDIWYHVAIPLGQLTDLDPRITHSSFGNHAGLRTFFFFSCVLSVITKGINYSARPGREGNNISKSLM